ncbi:hypothetical protein HFO33_35425 [Rhizobium leguminosarum]|uniref:hypothetical protein n=1 Tax=Rhizobium leguminosarum TaxID=384 RepID=UPI001C976D63|nr:hypothetical protein [Rhizobium leguminosarum]MBY5721782.1 hypothetical protein [Rhizobium leguminosarum]
MNETVSINSYRDLDLRPEGEIVNQLLSAVEAESGNQTIRLTDRVGSTPANLTPMMSSWYVSYIAGPRGQALDSIAAVLGANKDESRSRGVFLEREVSAEENLRIERKRQALRASREKRAAEYDRYSESRIEYQKAKDAYDELWARHGREAKSTSLWYIPLLILIGIPEILINFESFGAIRIYTPAIALGVTIVVALALAYASHVHGTFLRQYEARFGAHQRDGDRAAALRILGLGTTALILAMSSVYYARSTLLEDQILENSVIGGDAPSGLYVIGGSMIGNLGVWIIGALIAFFAHDEDHHFPEALNNKNKAEKKMYTLRESINGPLKREFEKVDATCEKAIEQAKNKHSTLGVNKDFADGRTLFAQLKEQDTQVIAALQAYRLKLIGAVKGRSQRYEVQPEIDTADSEFLDGGQYAALLLNVKYI